MIGSFRSIDKWYGYSFAIALLWSVEIFLFQEISLHESGIPMRTAIFSRIFRFLLDLLATGTLVVLFRRWMLYLFFAGFVVFSALVLEYYDYYGHALSWVVLVNQTSEGKQVVSYIFEMLNWGYILPVLLGIAGMVWLNELRERIEPKFHHRIKPAAVLFAAYVLLFVLLVLFVDPLSKIRMPKTWTFDRMGMTYGYLLTWAGQYVMHPDEDELIAMELSANGELPDRLAGKEYVPRAENHVVLLQVESLGFFLPTYKVNGRFVLPYLHSLMERSMFFKVHALHVLGSCDADFSTLCGKRPSNIMINYALLKYPYTNCLPSLANRYGYRSVSLHGHNGRFYNRRYAFEKMGFDEIWFAKELFAKMGFSKLPNAWNIDDSQLFEASLRLLGRQEFPHQFQFLITLTSHGPFTYAPPYPDPVFENPSTMAQRYLNSIRYVDSTIRKYIESLPDGCVVLIYGDHPSNVLEIELSQPKEFVPLFVFKKGENLATKQRTRNTPLATSGELTNADIYNFAARILKESAPITQ